MKKSYLWDPKTGICLEVVINENGMLSSFKIIDGTAKFAFKAENIDSYEAFGSLEELKNEHPESFI